MGKASAYLGEDYQTVENEGVFFILLANLVSTRNSCFGVHKYITIQTMAIFVFTRKS